MSKRAGDVRHPARPGDEVGIDAARYFFLMRKGDSQLTFDIELAKQQTDENPIFYVQMAHARLCGIFRTAGVEPGCRHRRARPRVAAGAGGHRAAQEAGRASRGGREGGARARAASHDRLPARARAGSVHGWYHHTRTVGRARRPSNRRGCSSRAPRASSSPTASPCSAFPPPNGSDSMSLLVVGSVALDSIFTPFGETADALGGSAVFFSVAGVDPPPGAGRRRGRRATIRSKNSSSWRRAASTGRAWSTPRARASAGRGSTPTTCRAARRWRPGSASSPTSSRSCRPTFRNSRVPVPRQHRSRAAAGRARPGAERRSWWPATR